MWNGGWHGWFFGPIMMIVFIAVAVVVVVLLVRWLGGPGHGGALHGLPDKTPLNILKERFARGEIDKEEFEERRRILSALGQRDLNDRPWYEAEVPNIPGLGRSFPRW